MESKRKMRVTNKSENQQRKRVNGVGGAPALMHRPAAVEAAPSPEKEGSVPTPLTDHTLPLQSAGILKREICAAPVRVLFRQRHHLLQQTIFECTAALIR